MFLRALSPRVLASWLIAAFAALALAACGGGGERQDAGEPAGEFPLEVTKAEFPAEQRLAQTSEMLLAIENTGSETVPDLAVTITIGEGADGAFYVSQPGDDLASPDRPVWVLEHGFPKLDGSDAPSGAEVAQTNTFAFGELDPGQSREIVWRVSALRGGTYTVNYVVAAGVHGKAKAVDDNGQPVRGSFTVTISSEAPQASVDDKGEVVVREPDSR